MSNYLKDSPPHKIPVPISSDFVGDFMDFAIKANTKNVDLLNRFAEGQNRARWTDYLWLFMLLALLGAFIFGWLFLIFWLIYLFSNFSIA
jgi:hypothetical protein